MYNRTKYVFMVLVLLGNVTVELSHATDQSKRASPRTEHGTIVDKGRGLAVQLSDGSTYPINEPQESVHHNQARPKVDDKVTVVLDENNTVLEIRPAGEGRTHQTITGAILGVETARKELTLQTRDGRRVYPLEKLELTIQDYPEGTEVIVEINKAGRVIDIHRTNK